MNKEMTKLVRNAEKLVADLEAQGFEVTQPIKDRINNPKLSGAGIAATKKILSPQNIREHAIYYRRVDGEKVGYGAFTASGGNFYTQLARQIIKDTRKITNPNTKIMGRKMYSQARAAEIYINIKQLERDTGVPFIKNVKDVSDLPNIQVDYRRMARALEKSKDTYTVNLIEATVQNPILTIEGNKKIMEDARRKGVITILGKLGIPETDANVLMGETMMSDFLSSTQWYTYRERMYYYEAMAVEATIRVQQDNNKLVPQNAPDTFEAYLPDDRRHQIENGIYRGNKNSILRASSDFRELFESYARQYDFYLE